ncbi:GAF domain-containing protein [Pleurocapsales cyanobacterium LEGE 10410]|nr:GAF domain-containing protein [Pleurocapsales cyanobacterium LEGE 10410]
MSSHSSLLLKKVVNHQVWLNIAKLCLAIAAEDENLLFTEHTLLKLANNDQKADSNQKLATEKFFLVITPKFNIFLNRENIAENQKHQITVAFERATIARELTRLGYQNKWSIAVTKYLKTNLIAQLNENSDSGTEFMLRVIKLLLEDTKPTQDHHSIYSIPPMEKLRQYQVEQERIFERIKIQIGQNSNLSEIIQTAINHSCSFLELDRLLIYQLNVPSEAEVDDFKPAPTSNTITYEAKSSDRIASALYFRDEDCWQKNLQSRDEHQGLGLIIDDVAKSSQLNPCVQTLMAKLEVKAKAIVPINVQGKLWGLIIAHQCFKPRQWDSQDLQFLRYLAEYLAIAIFHNQSYQQLQQQKQLLEKQVQIQAQQLKDALIAAEAASKSKHDFLGSMSHELRTPLTCVIGLSSTLLQWSSAKKSIALPPEKQQEYLHLIQQSGKHLLTLINNILEFSDVDSGKHLLDVQQISLSKVVSQSIELLQETALTKQIALSCQIKLQPEQDYFLADEVRLKEIIFHLLSNGIKFTPEGGKVTLRIWREKRRVVFQVEDTGIGIAAEEVPTLFEKFRQIENFRQRTHGGTGLGLALTKKLVELHGGTIEVESALEKGSMFTVYLPEKTALRLDSNLKSVSSSQTFAQTIILVTEDEESAAFICQVLNTVEYHVVWLMNSAMAIEQIELLQPRIIIVDCDCLAAGIKNIVNAIERLPLANKVDLVLLSDRFNHNKLQKFFESGIDDYLLKSMNSSQIIDKVNSLIGGVNYTETTTNDWSDQLG